MNYLNDVQQRLKEHYLTVLMFINFCEYLTALKYNFKSRNDQGFLEK